MHDCVICGCACYCHGDIDDCVVERPRYSQAHCEGCGCHEEGDPLCDEDYCCGANPCHHEPNPPCQRTGGEFVPQEKR